MIAFEKIQIYPKGDQRKRAVRKLDGVKCQTGRAQC
jgi:hypothetical protein